MTIEDIFRRFDEGYHVHPGSTEAAFRLMTKDEFEETLKRILECAENEQEVIDAVNMISLLQAWRATWCEEVKDFAKILFKNSKANLVKTEKRIEAVI